MVKKIIHSLISGCKGMASEKNMQYSKIAILRTSFWHFGKNN